MSKHGTFASITVSVRKLWVCMWGKSHRTALTVTFDVGVVRSGNAHKYHHLPSFLYFVTEPQVRSAQPPPKWLRIEENSYFLSSTTNGKALR